MKSTSLPISHSVRLGGNIEVIALGSGEKMELQSLWPPVSHCCCGFLHGPSPSAGQAVHYTAVSPLRVPFTSGTPVKVYGSGWVDMEIPASWPSPGSVRSPEPGVHAGDHSHALTGMRGHTLPHLIPSGASFPHPQS